MLNTVSFKKEIPVRYRAEVAVIGGGIAGVCAACAAVAEGRSVILVERFGVVGGNATSGGVAAFCGETAGQGRIFDEIIAGLESFDAIAPYRPYEEREARIFDHEILAVVLQEMLLRYQVKLLLHTRLAEAVCEDGSISSVILADGNGLEALSANQFIDCSGEAVLAHAAGFKTMETDPGRKLPMSMMYFVRHLAELEEQVPQGWFEHYQTKDDLPMTSIWPAGPNANAIKIKVAGFDSCDTESLTEAEIKARRRMMSVLDYHQRVENRKWKLDHCSPIIGIREGRRVVGDYVLTVDDLRAGRMFDDAIARGVFYLDGHDPTNDKRTYILPEEELKVPPYQIPFRCLHPVDATNLLVAGRCLSADQLALSSARVMTTCAMMGQAAGIAASQAASTENDVRRVDSGAIRDKIVEYGGTL